jgi:outer membrane protein OmpA-like peptidoglycan-associated protein
MLCLDDCFATTIMPQPTEITQFIFGQPLKSGKKVDAVLQHPSGGEGYGYYKAIDAQDVPVRVVVNDREVDLPAVHARWQVNGCPEASNCGSFMQGEFWFLDNLDAPITLRFLINDEDKRQDKLNVVKIIVPVQQKQLITAALTNDHRVSLEGVYFDFDKATIRPESGVVLSSVAEVLRENPSWKVRVEGHTDNIGTDAYNLKLSTSRAAAVRQALAAQYHVSAARLTTAGYGASQPKATNDTLEGRAFNRRVELVRTDQAK